MARKPYSVQLREASREEFGRSLSLLLWLGDVTLKPSRKPASVEVWAPSEGVEVTRLPPIISDRRDSKWTPRRLEFMLRAKMEWAEPVRGEVGLVQRPLTLREGAVATGVSRRRLQLILHGTATRMHWASYRGIERFLDRAMRRHQTKHLKLSREQRAYSEAEYDWVEVYGAALQWCLDLMRSTCVLPDDQARTIGLRHSRTVLERTRALREGRKRRVVRRT